MDVLRHNRDAWNRLAKEGCRWARPVDSKTVRRAMSGDWEVILTPNRPVPGPWLGAMGGKRVLCLAPGGGQQAPILAAAGAEVVSFDLSEAQLEMDRTVSEREGLSIRCVQGDMADLSALADQGFDLVFNPVSTVFVPNVIPVWNECFRVLRPGGALLSGFMNPCFFLFDHDPLPEGEAPLVRYRLPYAESDPSQLSPARMQEIATGEAVEFSHSLDDLIGGQLDTGFVITGFYEDRWDDASTPLNRYMPTSMATRAVRPR